LKKRAFFIRREFLVRRSFSVGGFFAEPVRLRRISFVGTKEMKINSCKVIFLDAKKINTTFDIDFLGR
jgi:hypothetical protein